MLQGEAQINRPENVGRSYIRVDQAPRGVHKSLMKKRTRPMARNLHKPRLHKTCGTFMATQDTRPSDLCRATWLANSMQQRARASRSPGNRARVAEQVGHRIAPPPLLHSAKTVRNLVARGKSYVHRTCGPGTRYEVPDKPCGGGATGPDAIADDLSGFFT